VDFFAEHTAKYKTGLVSTKNIIIKHVLRHPGVSIGRGKYITESNTQHYWCE